MSPWVSHSVILRPQPCSSVQTIIELYLFTSVSLGGGLVFSSSRKLDPAVCKGRSACGAGGAAIQPLLSIPVCRTLPAFTGLPQDWARSYQQWLSNDTPVSPQQCHALIWNDRSANADWKTLNSTQTLAGTVEMQLSITWSCCHCVPDYLPYRWALKSCWLCSLRAWNTRGPSAHIWAQTAVVTVP